MEASKRLLCLLGCFALVGLTGCDLEDIEPYEGKTEDQALNTAQGLQTATLGNYQILKGGGYEHYIKIIFQATEYPADNVSLSGTTSNPLFYIYNYDHFPSMGKIPDAWQYGYQLVYGANQVIENIGENPSSEEMRQLKGENLFLRALVHFQLVQLFGRPYMQGRDHLGIPIVDSTSYVDRLPARNTVGEVYDFIEADLLQAAELMTVPKPNVFASREVAWALLSRVYLERGENEQVIEYANQVLDSDRYQLVDTQTLRTYPETPPESNPETIFAVKFTPPDNEEAGSICSMYYSEGGVGWGEMYASASYRELLNQHPEDARQAFIEPQYQRDENGDLVRDENGEPVLRQRNGLPRYYVDKLCKQGGQAMLYSPVILRLAEIYLNRAEARAKLGQPEGAIADVNRIRERAGLSGEALYAVGDLGDHDSVLDVVLEERRLELAFEGHRKYDLLRNGRPLVRTYPGYHLVENIPGVNMQEGTQIIPPDHPRMIFYIPEQEIELNPNLEQNPPLG